MGLSFHGFMGSWVHGFMGSWVHGNVISLIGGMQEFEKPKTLHSDRHSINVSRKAWNSVTVAENFPVNISNATDATKGHLPE